MEEIDIAGDFKLDDILADKQDENDSNNSNNSNKNNNNDSKKMYNSINNYEAKKIMKKIGTRLSSEELEKKQHLIIQITRFRDSSRFSNFLNSLGFQLSPSHLKTLDIGELQDILIELKSAIQNKNGSKIAEEGYFMTIGMLENITKHPKFNKYLDLEGLSKASRENDELLDTLECISLLYADFGNLSPEKKLVFLTMSNIMRVSALNKMLKNIKAYEEKLKNETGDNIVNQPIVEKNDNDEKNHTFQISENNIVKNTNNIKQNTNGGLLNFDLIQN
jgi:hypothetical protein